MSIGSHLVRVGLFGQIGRFRAPAGEVVARGLRVVCRTRRGLEIGEVLREPSDEEPLGAADGTLLRRVTAEDDLLLARLERDREQAFARCARLLDERVPGITLVDVEHLFDGRSLFFYFLGEMSSEVEALTQALTQELAETYEATVRFRQFADALQHGCGPDCGTNASVACSSACGSCAVAGACSR
jgi:cell fate regulator YaaT (PSP1 superfamily)